jgi:hypothetical protein
MTKEETILWNLADSYLAKSGYAVVGIASIPDAKVYTLKITQFGSNATPKNVTIFSDWLQRTVADDCLVNEVIQNIDDAIGK